MIGEMADARRRASAGSSWSTARSRQQCSASSPTSRCGASAPGYLHDLTAAARRARRRDGALQRDAMERLAAEGARAPAFRLHAVHRGARRARRREAVCLARIVRLPRPSVGRLSIYPAQSQVVTSSNGGPMSSSPSSSRSGRSRFARSSTCSFSPGRCERRSVSHAIDASNPHQPERPERARAAHHRRAGIFRAAPTGAQLEWVVSRSAGAFHGARARRAGRRPRRARARRRRRHGDPRHGALAGRNRVPLGILPVGSGNDFAAAIGVPRAPADALNVLLHGAPRRVDAGRAGRAGEPLTAPATAASPLSAWTSWRCAQFTARGSRDRRRSTSTPRCGRCSSTGRAAAASPGRAAPSRAR